jgi:hypothetical protein
MALTGSLEPRQRLLNIDRVSEVAKQNIVEFFLGDEIFGKSFIVLELRVCNARYLDHLRADLDSHAVSRLNSIQEKTSLATNVQYALPRLDQMTKRAAEQHVVIIIPPNPLVPGRCHSGLMKPVAIIS